MNSAYLEGFCHPRESGDLVKIALCLQGPRYSGDDKVARVIGNANIN